MVKSQPASLSTQCAASSVSGSLLKKFAVTRVLIQAAYEGGKLFFMFFITEITISFVPLALSGSFHFNPKQSKSVWGPMWIEPFSAQRDS